MRMRQEEHQKKIEEIKRRQDKRVQEMAAFEENYLK